MADWSAYLAQLYARNAGIFGGTGGDAPGGGGILGALAGGGQPQSQAGILGSAMPAQPQDLQSMLGPLNRQPQTISPEFADQKAASALPPFNAASPMYSPPSLQGQNMAPQTDDSGSFWSRNRPDGTQDILGGFLRYDPSKDMGRDNRFGLIGASLADAGANIGGHPEAAKNLATFLETQKKLSGQKALADVMNNLGGGATPAQPVPMQPPPRLADNARAQLPQMGPGGNGSVQDTGGGPMTATLPTVQPPVAVQNPGTAGLPQLPPSQPGSQFNLQTLGPKLAALAATGVDISPVVSILKDLQPKYSTTPNYTRDGKAYLVGENGAINWLSPDVTPRDKMEVASNGQVYDPYTVQPGQTFNDPNKPFGIGPNGQLAANKPVQQFEMSKVNSPAMIRANAEYARMNQENLQPPVQIGFSGADGEEKQVAASWNRKIGKYVDVSTGQPITSTPNLRVIGNATGGGRSMAMAGRVSTAALDAATDIENLSGIGTGAGMGLFANVTTSPLSALSRKLTPQEVQDTQTTMAGLSRAMSLLGSGGMQGSDTVMKSFDLLQPNTGDSMLTTMRKLGSFRQQAGNGIDAALASPMYSPDQKKQLQQAKAKIEAAVPWTPHDVQTLENKGQSGTSMREVFAAKLAKGNNSSSTASLPRIAQPPSGTISGVKWKLVSPGGQ